MSQKFTAVPLNEANQYIKVQERFFEVYHVHHVLLHYVRAYMFCTPGIREKRCIHRVHLAKLTIKLTLPLT